MSGGRDLVGQSSKGSAWKMEGSRGLNWVKYG